MTNRINSEDRAGYKAEVINLNGEDEMEIYGVNASYVINPKMPISDEEQQVLDAAKLILDKRIRHGDVLDSPQITREYLRIELSQELSEVFCMLWLDTRNRVINFQRMFNGTVDGASVFPREIVRHALHHNAAACIMVHNHPSGVPEPSNADERITMRIKDSLSLVDVRVLDHMIVGDTIVSFAERGLL